MPYPRLPNIREGKNQEWTMQFIVDAYNKMRKTLEFLLRYLDDDNVLSLDASKIRNLTAEQIFTDVITAGTSINHVLYAKEGRIARLTVDHLLTGDFISGDEYIYFIDAKDQYLKFIIGHRNDSLPQVHYATEDDQPLYWDSAEENYMTPNETAFPVMVYVYDLMTKLQMDFEYDGVYMVPKIILGAGVGNEDYPERGKGYIYKTDDGLLIKYVQSDGGILSMKMGEDGFVIDPPLFIFPENKNESQIVATAETAMPGMEITLKENAKVKFTAQMDVTASEAMTLLVKARINGVEHRRTVKYYAGAYKDGLCFSGLFDSVEAGTHIIDMSITPSTGTATIDAEEYHLVLTIENAISVIDYTQRQRWEDYPETPDVLIEYPYQAIIETDYAYGGFEGIWFRPITVNVSGLTKSDPDEFPTTWPVSDFSRAFVFIRGSKWSLVEVPIDKYLYYFGYDYNDYRIKFTTSTTYTLWEYDNATGTWSSSTKTSGPDRYASYLLRVSADSSLYDMTIAYYPLNIYGNTSRSTIWRTADAVQTELVAKGYDTFEAFYTGYAGGDYKLLIVGRDLIWAENVSTNKEFRTGEGNDVADREYLKLYRLVNGAWVPHEDYPNIYALRVRAADLTGEYVRVVECNTPIYDGFAGIATNTKLYEKTT